ncbi:MAG: alpha/beta hydrolase [Acidobacteria bacterium]|nr:alpha/beta hydrolase [Acidobacteriota bacterium]
MKTHRILVLILAVWLTACGNQPRNQAEGPREAPSVGKVDEKLFIELGDERQHVEMRGESDGNPVLLFIHGGPGWPETPQLRYFNADLTKAFTLVAWEQRGAGKSFMKNPAPKNVTLEQIVADARELTAKLREKFKQPKIYLAGYSWGSIVGINLVEKYPEDYAAYIGIGQVVNMKRGMEISQEWLAGQAREKGDAAALKTLEKLKNPAKDFCRGDLQCFIKQYELVMKYGGAVYNKNADRESEAAIAASGDYKNYDWNKAFEFSAAALEKDMFAADFRNVREIKIPVFLFLGRHDWNVPSVLAQEFVENLNAPKKEIVWLENSAHSPLAEEPQEFNRLLVEKVLKGK